VFGYETSEILLQLSLGDSWFQEIFNQEKPFRIHSLSESMPNRVWHKPIIYATIKING
jgi:hypothetical protein